MTALTILIYIDAILGTVGVLLPLSYAFKHRALPRVPLIGRLLSGPFERLGMDAFIVAGLVFVVSGLKVLAAYWLGQARLDGAVLQLILLSLSAIFWYGFAVPFGPVFGLPQLVLVGDGLEQPALTGCVGSRRRLSWQGYRIHAWPAGPLCSAESWTWSDLCS
jgi:hypothetical protein